MESTVGIALLGCGTVGGGVAEVLSQRRAHIEHRSGISYDIVGIANRSRDPIALVDDKRVDVVVEAIGGTGIALECIERGLDHHKHVVTANKDVIATQGPRLRALAAARGVTLRYEASVASAVPIISTLDHALAGDEILEVGGVLNGTCNFILGKMRDGQTFNEALRQAQQAGYAEADPRSDIEGTDAAHKLAILIQHAFLLPVITPHVPHRGIAGVTSAAVRRARQHGYELKLVAYARRILRQAQDDKAVAQDDKAVAQDDKAVAQDDKAVAQDDKAVAQDDKGIVAEVGPVLVPFTHPFARCSGVENIVRVVGASAGPLFFSGAGAGREAAASAMIGDVVATLRTIAERHGARAIAHAETAQSIGSAFSSFPAFDGYPVLRQALDDGLTTKGDTHVGHSPRTLSAV